MPPTVISVNIQMRKYQDGLSAEKSPYSHMYRLPSPDRYIEKEDFKRAKSQTSLLKKNEPDHPPKQKRLVLEPGTPC